MEKIVIEKYSGSGISALGLAFERLGKEILQDIHNKRCAMFTYELLVKIEY